MCRWECGFEPFDLLVVVNDDGEFAFEGFAVVICAETAFEHEDGFFPAHLTHEFGIGKIEHGQSVGALTQYGIDVFDTVTVGIGFDHDPHPCLAELGLPANLCEVVGDGVQVDGGEYRTRHDGL